MNELQKCRNYLVSKFNEDKLVNTITALTDDIIDTNKETIYPVVNLNYQFSTVNDDSILVNYQVKVLDQLDVFVKNTDSKLLQDTNVSDVLNETFNICQTFINSFRKYNSDNIEIGEVSQLSVINKENLNGLSGHAFDIVLIMPNEGSGCQ